MLENIRFKFCLILPLNEFAEEQQEKNKFNSRKSLSLPTRSHKFFFVEHFLRENNLRRLPHVKIFFYENFLGLTKLRNDKYSMHLEQS